MKFLLFLTSVSSLSFLVNGNLRAIPSLNLVHNGPSNVGDNLGGGEILSYDSLTKRIFTTRTQTDTGYGVNYFDYSNPASPQALGFIDLASYVGGNNAAAAVSSIAIDPLGRGFGAAVVIPRVSSTINSDYSALGVMALFDTQTGSVLKTLNVGYHPDSVIFSPDGSKLIITNEGEHSSLSTAIQRPGSLSVIDVSSISQSNRVSEVGALAQSSLSTVDLSGYTGNLSSIRHNGTAVGTGPLETQIEDIEPEYVSVVGQRAYVSFQENNALGVFDLNTLTWESIHSLGTINQSIDPTINDGPRTFTKNVKGLPMPDNIAAFTHQSRTYVFTANEGDSRVDGRDEMTVAQLNRTGFPTYEGPALEDPEMRNLRISRIDGDTDADGSIDEIHMFGTRSISLYDGLTGDRLWDSGDLFEREIITTDPTGYVDGQSPRKGPEPEALAIGEVDGTRILVVALERSNHLFLFDISTPESPILLDIDRISLGGEVPVRPESLTFIPAGISPTGQALLAVGYEGQESTETERIVLYSFSAVPEPSGAILGGFSSLLIFRRRR